MSRSLYVPIVVDANAAGHPRFLHWHGQRLPIARLLDAWCEAGCWWADEEERTVFLIETRQGGVYEIYRSDPSGRWILATARD